jgi:acyl carrier protein
VKEFNKNINNKVLSSFAEALKIDPLDINIERNFAEYSNLDSLGFVKLIVSLNEKFNIELDTELVLECDNIIQISNYIKGLITGKN